MAVSLSFRFITGTYAATAWDSSANSGTVEWPPSPWRISRALLATAHDRMPQEDFDSTSDAILALAAEPPIYLVPPSVSNHTRHYLPDWDHRSGQTSATSLTLNSMLSISPEASLYVSWPQVELSEGQQANLQKCIARLSYLGRAESLVEGKLVADLPAGSDHDLLLPGRGRGAGTSRVLCPAPEVTRDDLEITPDQMRKRGLLTPPGARWVDYDPATEVVPGLVTTRRVTPPTVVRWALDSRAPFRETHGILATDRVRGYQLRRLRAKLSEVPMALTGHFPRTATGQQTTTTGHDHAHWLWLSDEGRLTDLVLWIPSGIDREALPHLARPSRLDSQADGYTPTGFVDFGLQLIGIGRPEQVAPELVAGANGSRVWQTSTPYLLTRHMKRGRDLEALLEEDVRAEWAYRNPGPVEVASIERMPLRPDVREYRRYRWKETMASRRTGFGLRLVLTAPITGPLFLGALSHFGFGRFSPAEEP